MKGKGEEFYARAVAELPRILLGLNKATEIRKTGSEKMAEVLLAENVERKTSSQVPRSDLEVCCMCRRFIFEEIFGLKLTLNKCNFGFVLWPKIGMLPASFPRRAFFYLSQQLRGTESVILNYVKLF